MSNHSQTSRNWLIIPAAGIGSRMQAEIPKQYLKLQNKTILEHTLTNLLDSGVFESVFVALHPADALWEELIPESLRSRVSIYKGGAERSDTVRLGLEALKGIAQSHDWVWVHDAARPCVSLQELQDLQDELASTDVGALLALPVSDTVKLQGEDRSVQTIPRERVWRAQTPQVFSLKLLDKALSSESRGGEITDESSAVEQLGYSPVIVPGRASNIKITQPEDLAVARAYLTKTFESSAMTSIRIGSGYDVHAFCEGDSITLGGVLIPHKWGLLAHSDGDVLLHAICDALLGALALGDIGKHFPDTSAEWKGANSRDLLRAVRALIVNKGYRVVNVDSTIIAQAPKMAPHIDAMRDHIAADLDLVISAVSVKATTTEKLGFTGREEGIACQATVLLELAT